MGVFAKDNIHPHDMYRYYVYRVDGIAKTYLVNKSFASWTDGEFSDYSNATSPDYFLIIRDWYSAARDIFAVNDSAYWNTTAELRSMYTIDYKDELIGAQLINTVTISFYFNETNYDIIKYTRAEGILLSREVKIDVQDKYGPGQDMMGEFKITLHDFDGGFEVSFWTYVIWFFVIFGIIMGLIITISVLISRRQEKLKNIDY
ncbi:MAG: hypothetical protein ACTSVC_10620 [Promethearchaeota archaeon]